VLLDYLRESVGRTEAKELGSINASGLTPMEFRGQCAMVRASCRDHLAQPEYDAVRARYGRQLSKAHGVQGLVDYVKPILSVDNDLALKAVAWGLFHRGGDGQRWSQRQIEAETGVSQPTLSRTSDAIDKASRALLERADRRLSQLFQDTGLISKN